MAGLPRSRTPKSRSWPPRVEVEAPVVEVEVSQVEVEVPRWRSRSNLLGSFIHLGPGREPALVSVAACGSSLSTRGGIPGSATRRRPKLLRLAAVAPQGLPPKMAIRFGSFNVDIPATYFNGDQTHNGVLERFLNDVDVAAFQELGSWDVPLKQEPRLRALALALAFRTLAR